MDFCVEELTINQLNSVVYVRVHFRILFTVAEPYIDQMVLACWQQCQITVTVHVYHSD